MIKEQYCNACIENGDVGKAFEIVNELKARFGANSNRVQLLAASAYELSGEFDKAEKV